VEADFDDVARIAVSGPRKCEKAGETGPSDGAAFHDVSSCVGWTATTMPITVVSSHSALFE
jgi:hypothetical protein